MFDKKLYMQERFDAFRRAGLCFRCNGRNKLEPGRKSCTKCLSRNKSRKVVSKSNLIAVLTQASLTMNWNDIVWIAHKCDVEEETVKAMTKLRLSNKAKRKTK